jgi:hypothetical protein
MYDFSKKVRKFHEDHVRLTSGEQSDMRTRRERNLKRIEDGLAELDKPKVAETINQGGYAQRTMTQPPENDADSRYDIDLGIVFEQDDAKTPRTTRDWVRQAIARKGSGFKNDPVTKKKCVRVVYSNGYQCDFPVFRRRWTEVGYRYELSSGDGWVASDPAAMNEWIKNKVAISPVSDGSYQLRRIIRYGKFYSKTHAHRMRASFPGGLVATAIFIECYVEVDGRDDQSIRETLRNISLRSKYAPVYANGVQVSDDKDIERIGRLIGQAKASAEELDKLDGDVSEKEARKAWRRVFVHSFFDEPKEDVSSTAKGALEKKSALSSSLAAPALASGIAAALSDDARADRLRVAAEVRKSEGTTSKPWAK